jgi:hypothetical protein
MSFAEDWMVPCWIRRGIYRVKYGIADMHAMHVAGRSDIGSKSAYSSAYFDKVHAYKTCSTTRTHTACTPTSIHALRSTCI